MKTALLLAALIGLAAPRPAAAQGQLTVYCSILEEQCRLGVATFERATGIKVAMVRKSTGETYAQIKAEASKPRADVWWGGPGDPHFQAAEEGLLDKNTPPKLAQQHAWAARHAEQSGWRTAGIYLGTLGIGYNPKALASRGIP